MTEYRIKRSRTEDTTRRPRAPACQAESGEAGTAAVRFGLKKGGKPTNLRG